MLAHGLALRSHYFDDPEARNEFKRFLIAIHKLDLSLWESSGFWDSRCYVAFSLFDGARIVSTVNLFSMDLVVQGERRRVGQLSGVGTDPAFRRRGLARQLTELAMKWAAPTHEGFFLFATDEAIPFYRGCGFQPVRESAALLAVTPPPIRPGLRKLDMGSNVDRDLVSRLSCDRVPVSEVLGALTPSLLMFHSLYSLHDCGWYVPDLDVVVFFRTDGHRLTLFDVVGRSVPAFAVLHPYLAGSPHREVCFQFEPDRMGVRPTGRVPQDENNTHVFAPFRMPEPECLFPFVAHA